jgi:hypothetical protein
LNVTRHIARDDLCQHAHCRADLLFATFISEQTGQDFFSERLFCGIQNTVRTALCDAS